MAKKAEKQRTLPSEAKVTIILLNLVLCFTLFFAAYGVYAQNYSPNNQHLSLAVGQLEELSSNSSGAGAVQMADEQIESPNYVVTNPINIVLYKFEESTPQPMAYYTDLLEINNPSNASVALNIRIENLQGQENLGRIILWLFENQTNTPNMDTPLATAEITNSTTGIVNLITNYSLKPNSTIYIELAGFASINSPTDSRITFDFAIEEY